MRPDLAQQAMEKTKQATSSWLPSYASRGFFRGWFRILRRKTKEKQS